MDVTRRMAYAQFRDVKIARTTETRSTCPYCPVSCGVIIHTVCDNAKNVTARVVHVGSDPDHPINRGTLWPKGSSLLSRGLTDLENQAKV
jgi:formate dehydrogenase major subunit